MKAINWLILVISLLSIFCGYSQYSIMEVDTIPYKIYPQVNKEKPALPSPFRTKDDHEYVIAVTKEGHYGIIRVTPANTYEICKQLIVDTLDFPELAQTGLHTEAGLDTIQTITGRALEKITMLGRPNGLSQAGFMARDENIISVIKGDNSLLVKLGFTHPQMARPLFHVLNMIDADLSLKRWNMAKHKWENIQYFYYNNQKVFVEAEDTKGGQKSIFNDGIEGAFYVKLWRELHPDEINYLKDRYTSLTEDNFKDLISKLSVMHTGEMEPQYIMRYGFYEGHTYWRTDPIAITFIFGLIDLPELDDVLENNLYYFLTEHYTE